MEGSSKRPFGQRKGSIRPSSTVASISFFIATVPDSTSWTTTHTPKSDEDVGDAANYLSEGAVAQLPIYGGRPISVDLPASVELDVTAAEPGVKGDRVSGATKPVTLETGLVVQAPLFIEAGDRVKVDTRSGEYITRV